MASGLMMVSVRSKSFYVLRSTFYVLQHRGLWPNVERRTSNVEPLLSSENLFHPGSDVGGGTDDGDPGGLQGLDLVGGRTFAAGDDGARVAHAASRGRGLSRDKRDDRFLEVPGDVTRGCLLRQTSDLPDQDH